MARELVKTYSHISEEGQNLFAPGGRPWPLPPLRQAGL